MIIINSINFNHQEDAVLNQAAALWDQQLNSAISIRLHIEKTALGNGLLGLTIPNGVLSPAHGVANSWYVSALADHVSGMDHQPHEPDAAIYLDSTVPWYIGPPHQIPHNDYDFFSTALHEMGHAFGYLGLFSKNNNDGLYGRLTAHIVPPTIHLPFPFPNLNGWPSVLGLKTLSAQAGNYPLVNPGVQCPPQGFVLLGQDLVNPALFQINGGTRNVYAPGVFQLFSSFDHIDPHTYPHALMQPALPTGLTRRVIDADSWSVLHNLGW